MKFKQFFSFLSIVSALVAGAMLSSCNKDDVIGGDDIKPKIILDSETGIYTVKAGEELVVEPTYENASGADYSWTVDGTEIADTPMLRYTWTTPGDRYIRLTVTAAGGSASEELKAEVIQPAPPVISLPVSGDAITIALGTDFVFNPEISNSEFEDFSIEWTLDGQKVSDERSYTFSATATGNFILRIRAQNSDGTDTKEIRITVVNSLPYVLSFPTPSYFEPSTTRYTFAGRPVHLTPVMENLTAQSFAWTVNGSATDCDKPTFIFTPDSPGNYIINLTVDSKASASVKVICVDATESQRYRAATASSSPRSNKVFEWVPAPGQFIGETQTGGMTGNETTLALANVWAETRLANQHYVSLGGFGGYIIVGFDHSISKRDGQYDFAVMGNAFLNASSGSGGSNEPGIIYVMQDINGNGLPDDEWYELRGSETGNATTRQDYAVTYFRPSGPGMNVQWTDNYGASGHIDYLNAFHRQPYYYPAWIEADSYTLRGTCLANRTSQDSSTGFWDNSAFPWGYSDNMGSDNMTGADAISGSGQRNGFLIENAMFSDGSHVNLQYIDFIKVETGVNSKAGWLGEVSTEVFNFQDLSLMPQ